MTLPTAAEFKARHARFAAVVDATCDAYLAEAGTSVDATVWAAADYAPGVMYLAAHQMEVEGARAPTGNPIGIAGAVKKRKAGAVEIEYAVAASTGTGIDDAYAATTYGRKYLELAARNAGLLVPGILVV